MGEFTLAVERASLFTYGYPLKRAEKKVFMNEIETSLRKLGEAFRQHPFDFYKENDITCFLYEELRQRFPDRVPVKLADGIEQFSAFQDTQRMLCSRVHTEVNKIDIVILENREQIIRPKSQNMMGKIEPPFLAGIEVKMAYGKRSSRFSGIPSGAGVVEDVEKLACLAQSFSYSYVVIVDFFEKRNLQAIRQKIELYNKGLFNKVRLFYAGLDKYELILPEEKNL
jgi:hypothetical protein